MSSRSGNGGGGVQSIPAASSKMVQSLKEIVNCPESEIYAMLKECNMDPNEAVNRLLSQGLPRLLSMNIHYMPFSCYFIWMRF